jgi:hypothetical protein
MFAHVQLVVQEVARRLHAPPVKIRTCVLILVTKRRVDLIALNQTARFAIPIQAAMLVTSALK